MRSAISELIIFLENSMIKEKDPAELEELRRTLSTARKLADRRKRRSRCA